MGKHFKRSLNLLVTLIILSFTGTCLAQSVGISYEKKSTYDMFSNQPWPNETQDMFQQRRSIIASCTDKESPKKDDFSSKEYSEFYQCWIKGVTKNRYPVSSQAKSEIEPVKSIEVSKNDIQVNPEYRCGDPTNGLMIELENLENLGSQLILRARVFKDGKFFKNIKMGIAGYGSTKSYGKNGGSAQYVTVGIKTPDGLKMSKIFKSRKSGASIQVDGEELACSKLQTTPATQNSPSGNQ